jgi:hypothetical protein
MARLSDEPLKKNFGDIYGWEAWEKAENEAFAEWAKKYKNQNSGDLVGEVLQWPRADGYAKYMVISQSPLVLAHIDIGDAFQVEYALIKGLALKDVKQMVEFRKKLVRTQKN